MGPPETVPAHSPSSSCTRYFCARVTSENLVAIPRAAVTHIQKSAPGPPQWIASATPAMLPIPTVADSAVVSAWKWVTSPSSSGLSYLPDATATPWRSRVTWTKPSRRVRYIPIPSRMITIRGMFSPPIGIPTSTKYRVMKSMACWRKSMGRGLLGVTGGGSCYGHGNGAGQTIAIPIVETTTGGAPGFGCGLPPGCLGRAQEPPTKLRDPGLILLLCTGQDGPNVGDEPRLAPTTPRGDLGAAGVTLVRPGDQSPRARLVEVLGGGVGQPVVRGKVFPVFPDECSGHERNLRAAATLRQPTPHPTPPLTRR